MDLPDSMWAARYPTSGPDAGVIRVERVPRPDPGPGEVLVAVAVSGVNPTDWKARSNRTGTGSSWVTPNQDGAGRIVAVGRGVPAQRVGERVWVWQAAWNRAGGTAAEYVAVPADQAVALPSSASYDLGAGLGIPAMTAYHCLFHPGPPRPGDRVLVHGGAGAVGHAAIELARHRGAEVAATVSNAYKAKLAAAAGADLVIDYRTEDVAAAVRRWAPAGVARIVEVDLARNLTTDSAVVAPGGAIAVYARTEQPVLPPWDLMVANARVDFVLVYTIDEDAERAAVEGVTTAVRDGALTPLPGARFSLAEAAAAHDAVQAGHTGKVLIDVGTA